MPGSATAKPRLLGINHVALEVGDIDEALVFYGRFFDYPPNGDKPPASSRFASA